MKEVKAVDANTISIVTTRPDPVLLHALANIQIIPSELASATTDSFNTGKSAIGSGPYKFVSFKAGDRLELARNPEYWGNKAKWDRVTFRFIPDDAARVAALLGNDVDLIDFVPPRLVERVKSAPNAALFLGPSDRTIFLIPDTERDASPFVKDKDGNRLAKNPLKDKRVREAIALSIDRDLLTKRVMDGAAIPSSQPTAPGFGGYHDGLKVPAFDPSRAKRLLADAGYQEGFSMTVHCTNDRYVNDERVCQAVGTDAGARRHEDVGRDAAPLGVLSGRNQPHLGRALQFYAAWMGQLVHAATPVSSRTSCTPMTARAASAPGTSDTIRTRSSTRRSKPRRPRWTYRSATMASRRR